MSFRRMDAGAPRPGGAGGNRQRVNEMIRVPQVLVISEQNEQLGVMNVQDALAHARSLDLDLVEVDAQAKPPVCRIMDYGKFKYDQKKKLAKQRTTQQDVKEIRLRPNTGKADVDVKIKKIRELLTKEKAKVILSIVYRGREITHVDEGRKLMDYILSELTDVGKTDVEPKLMGKRMICTIAPITAK